jgi:hypothetical protein
MEAKVILTLLIELIGGETDAGGPRPGVLVIGNLGWIGHHPSIPQLWAEPGTHTTKLPLSFFRGLESIASWTEDLSS